MKIFTCSKLKFYRHSPVEFSSLKFNNQELIFFYHDEILEMGFDRLITVVSFYVIKINFILLNPHKSIRYYTTLKNTKNKIKFSIIFVLHNTKSSVNSVKKKIN